MVTNDRYTSTTFWSCCFGLVRRGKVVLMIPKFVDLEILAEMVIVMLSR